MVLSLRSRPTAFQNTLHTHISLSLSLCCYKEQKREKQTMAIFLTNSCPCSTSLSSKPFQSRQPKIARFPSRPISASNFILGFPTPLSSLKFNRRPLFKSHLLASHDSLPTVRSLSLISTHICCSHHIISFLPVILSKGAVLKILMMYYLAK